MGGRLSQVWHESTLARALIVFAAVAGLALVITSSGSPTPAPVTSPPTAAAGGATPPNSTPPPRLQNQGPVVVGPVAGVLSGTWIRTRNGKTIGEVTFEPPDSVEWVGDTPVGGAPSNSYELRYGTLLEFLQRENGRFHLAERGRIEWGAGGDQFVYRVIEGPGVGSQDVFQRKR